jgi:hypothetical protein
MVCCLMRMLWAGRAIVDWISGCGTGCCMQNFSPTSSSSLDNAGIRSVLSSMLWKARFEGCLPVIMLVSIVVSAFSLFCQTSWSGSAWNLHLLSHSSWTYFTANLMLFSDSFVSLLIFLYFFSFLSLFIPHCAVRRDDHVVSAGTGVAVTHFGSSGVRGLSPDFDGGCPGRAPASCAVVFFHVTGISVLGPMPGSSPVTPTPTTALPTVVASPFQRFRRYVLVRLLLVSLCFCVGVLLFRRCLCVLRGGPYLVVGPVHLDAAHEHPDI